MTKQRKTGGSNPSYMVHITNPTTLDYQYDTECNDIIEALGLNFAEGNVLKALWRISAHRRGRQKHSTPQYDAEKILFFAKRIAVQNGAEGE